MSFIEVNVQFVSENPALATELVSTVFYDLGFYELVFDNGKQPEAASAADRIEEPAQHTVTAYFPLNEKTDGMQRDLEKKLRRLAQCETLKPVVFYRQIEEKDWSESWKVFFYPKKIGKRLVVKPGWRTYAPKADEIVLEIDPGMAFGTGTHPTTAMCLNLIEAYVQKGDAVLDIGAGSGILMLAAAKLGAGKTTGIDNDETAVKIAANNLARNHVDRRLYELICSDRLDTISGRYQLAVANILINTILGLLDDIHRVLLPGGIFIASGITTEQLPPVEAKMKTTGFDLLETSKEDEWAAVAARFGH